MPTARQLSERVLGPFHLKSQGWIFLLPLEGFRDGCSLNDGVDQKHTCYFAWP